MSWWCPVGSPGLVDLHTQVALNYAVLSILQRCGRGLVLHSVPVPLVARELSRFARRTCLRRARTRCGPYADRLRSTVAACSLHAIYCVHAFAELAGFVEEAEPSAQPHTQPNPDSVRGHNAALLRSAALISALRGRQQVEGLSLCMRSCAPLATYLEIYIEIPRCRQRQRTTTLVAQPKVAVSLRATYKR